MAKTPGVPHAFGCFFVFYPCFISLDMSYKFRIIPKVWGGEVFKHTISLLYIGRMWCLLHRERHP